MDKRKKIAPDGKPYGKRHKICPKCREAATVNARKYRKARILNGAKSVQREQNTRNYKLVGGHLFVPAIGSARRLRALAVLGYSWNVLGRRLGQQGNNLSYTAINRQWVYPQTAQKIKALYDELSMLPVSVEKTDPKEKGNRVKVVKTRALRKGWLPPLAWEDETIDDPYALPVGLTVEQAYNWFWNSANEIERIEWVLEHGLPRRR